MDSIPLEKTELDLPSPVASLPPPPNPGASWKRRLLSLAKWTGLGALTLSAIGGTVAWAIVQHYSEGLPTIAELRAYRAPQVTRVLARDGTTVLAEIFTQRRTVVPFASLPPQVRIPFLAAEDAEFYDHFGVNPLGLLRALIVDLKRGKGLQGGSTITQQLVRNMSLGFEHSLRRKIREALLAIRIETALDKNEIFELYINQVNFGRGRFGIEEAARDVFGKSSHDLTIAEAAILAGVLPSPEKYNPRANMEKALTRRHYVLDQMRAKGFITEAQFLAADSEPVRLSAETEPVGDLAPEAVESARALLRKLVPDASKLGGYTITTTIDPKLQALARRSLRAALDAYDTRHALKGLKAPSVPKKGARPSSSETTPFEGTPSYDGHHVYVGTVAATDDATGTIDVKVGAITGTLRLHDCDRYNVNPAQTTASAFAPVGAHIRVSLAAPLPDTGAAQAKETAVKVPLRIESGPEGAFVALDVRTREVLALVGRYESAQGGLDRATQARRQPGSTFKPIVYSYALHTHKFTPATLIDVTPDVFEGGYHPSNYEGWSHKEPLRLREVLANSVNVGAVRVLQEVGPANVVSWAQSLGITSTMKPDLSLALGSYEVRPIELAGAYATFAAGGMYEEPVLILKIVGPDGKVVPLPERAPAHRALDESEAFMITNMLTSVVDHGTAARAKMPGRPLAGKTGTSNLSKDTWFAGHSPAVAAVVWVGYDDAKPLGGAEQGAVTALPAWSTFMKGALEGRAATDFPEPPGIVHRQIDTKDGKLAYEGDENTLDEVFLPGTEPTEMSTGADDAGVMSDGGATAVPATSTRQP